MEGKCLLKMKTFQKTAFFCLFIAPFCIAAGEQGLCDSLRHASAFGELDRIKVLLSLGVDINCRDFVGSTALHQSVRHSRTFEVTKYLVEHGADVNAMESDSMTPLRHATMEKEFATIRYLVEHGAQQKVPGYLYGMTPLCQAIEADSNDLAKFLITNGANVNPNREWWEESPLCVAAEHENYYMVNYLIERGADVNMMSRNPVCDNDPAISVAVCHKSLAIVRVLLQNSAKVTFTDRYGRTTLHKAAECGNIEYVKALLEYGADSNARDSNQAIPLHLAAEAFNPDLVSYLVSGSEKHVNAIDNNGNTPLHYTVKKFHKIDCPACKTGALISTIDVLTSNGADINARNNDGNTLLHLILSHKWYPGQDYFIAQLISILVARGANPTLTNKEGNTIYRMAATMELPKTQVALKKSGYDFSADDRSLALEKKNEYLKRTHEYLTKVLPGQVMAIGIPLTYLGLSAYTREVYYQDQKQKNWMNPVNSFATITWCGTAAGLLIGSILEPPHRGEMMVWDGRGAITILSGFVGMVSGAVIGSVVDLHKYDGPFWYYGAPIAFSVTVPLLFFKSEGN